MDARHLSRRLATAAEFVPAGARLADIGSDHAYLPAFLALQGQIKYAVAGEVVRGPYQNACREIKRENLQEIIVPRLADGLAAINADDRIDTVTICGMGGPLIRDILDAGVCQLLQHPRLILQPNVGERNVRRWCIHHGYGIVAERIIREDHHTYEIIVADYGQGIRQLSPEEELFGPFLMREHAKAFMDKWVRERTKRERILYQVQQAQAPAEARITQLRSEIKMITEVVANGNGK
ncbi:tRNA (adenine(22)-N(1))-methyltransferase [Ligilactobacillus sp. LYQ60]|uniref:tRNA (adenine(22)-N(1))-methyltransferase n=1 Tax=unclassified Ligilactobacillus TaxID=2767920 RepID=UPI0038551799